MNTLRTASETKRGLLALAAGLLVLTALQSTSVIGGSNPALAQQPEPLITIGFQEEATAGETIALAAYLQDPLGNPIYDAEVSFELDVEFLNVSDRLDLGTAITDDQGLALVEFEPRVEGMNNITASFAGNEVFAPVSSAAELEVVSGGQIYREFRPYRIPGANVWMTTAVITIVWIVFIMSLGLIGWANFRARRESGGSGA